ncbi:MAG TPA: peptide ABC transporter substrate-binding protein [Gemmatimonadaceae bacterium]|jgi:peptide/nickel transport system substrate-binding protein
MLSRALPLLVLAVLAACRQDDRDSADAGGTLIISVGAEPDALLPITTTSLAGNQVADIIFERLAEPGDSMNTRGDAGFVPELAESWTWSPDSLSIAFKLHPDAKWHDGRPVTARDVAFSFDIHKDPEVGSSVAPLLSRIDSVTASDSLTAVVWYRQRYPEQFLDAAFQVRIHPEHWLGQVKRSEYTTSPVVRSPVGSGRFKFARWEPGTVVEVVANTEHYRGRPKLDRILWTIAPDFNTSATRFFSGEADYLEYLRPENVEEIKKHPDLTITRYGSLDYGFVWFNLRDPRNNARPHPIFGDARVRRALSMAVDREKAVRSVLGDLGFVSVGPLPRAHLFGDSLTAIGYDPEGAKRLLDSLGWRDANGDGIREKGGRQLRFSLAAPTSSQSRLQFSVILQAMLRDVGARVELDHMELRAFQELLARKRWDAAMQAWRTDPTPSSIIQTWGIASIKDGVNFGSYESSTFDAAIDSATSSMDSRRAQEYYHRAYETIIGDAPAIWLYEPLNAAGHHSRIKVATMRPDAWWTRIHEWYIPRAERIPRDNIGLRAAAP